MLRRRLMLSSYSDEDEEQEVPQQQEQQQEGSEFQNVDNLQQPTVIRRRANANTDLPEPVPISDDEFLEVFDNFTPPSPPLESISNPSFQQPPPVPPVITGCPVGDFLSRLGLSLKTEWLDSCLTALGSSVQGLDVQAKAKMCFEQFLFSDMNYCGGGVLPPNVDSMHLVDLPGPFVLQVDEIVNISCPLKGRYQDAAAGVKRCLKLSMTDGVQRVFGMEYRPIKDLQVLAPAGLKVAICNVHIRHGLLMLVPEALEVLGGMVEELDAVRHRLVNEINKPPRGKRSRTGVIPPLATRATQAAWPLSGDNVPSNNNNSFSRVIVDMDSSVDDLWHSNDSVNVLGNTNSSVNAPGQSNRSTLQGASPFQSDDQVWRGNSSTLQGAIPFLADGQGVNLAAPGIDRSERMMADVGVPVSAENTVPNLLSSGVSNVEEMHIDAPTISRENYVSNQHSNAISDHKDVHMVNEFEHPLILSGDREIPFTYLASLSAKWAAIKETAPSVHGKVKCFLTGVKGFQYKHRRTYELQVYVDDGSLISEILIDHNVVLKGIGYTPEEVTAALSSSDKKRVGDMKETLRQLQIFLVNFEGIMLVEINGTSHLPVALEMSQGCPASDALLLMRRLTSSATPQRQQHSSFNPIDISP